MSTYQLTEGFVMQINYKIYAQMLAQDNKKTLLIIQVLGKTEQLARTAEQIMADKTLLSGFHPIEAGLIGYIHATERDCNSLGNDAFAIKPVTEATLLSLLQK
jgi:hypothetical protein